MPTSRARSNRATFDTAIKMLESWFPLIADGLRENLYQKHVASGEWVDRLIAERRGDPKAQLDILSKQNQALREQLANRVNEDVQTDNGPRGPAGISGQVDKLSHSLNRSPAERSEVFQQVNEAVATGSKDPSGITPRQYQSDQFDLLKKRLNALETWSMIWAKTPERRGHAEDRDQLDGTTDLYSVNRKGRPQRSRQVRIENES